MLRVEIKNPKAKRILEELADLNLITIQKHNSAKSFATLLKKMRGRKKPILLSEITKEVEAVRAKRYESKK